jgi:hypothetical protein
MLAASISAVTEDSSGVSPTTTVPESRVNCPRTLAAMRWRTENPTKECGGSIVQVPAGGREAWIWVASCAMVRALL